MIGAAGRMGRMILHDAIQAPDDYRIVGAVEAEGHPQLGQPLEVCPVGIGEDGGHHLTTVLGVDTKEVLDAVIIRP